MTALALSFVVFLAGLRLFDPFSGDQALFLVAAKTLHAGGVLYRDFWDVKQPGIFVFFLAIGNPLIYVLADRGESIGTNGWALQLYTPELWDRLNRQLQATAPRDVFVGEAAVALLTTHSPPAAAYLARKYGTAASTPDGRWLRLKTR